MAPPFSSRLARTGGAANNHDPQAPNAPAVPEKRRRRKRAPLDPVDAEAQRARRAYDEVLASVPQTSGRCCRDTTLAVVGVMTLCVFAAVVRRLPAHAGPAAPSALLPEAAAQHHAPAVAAPPPVQGHDMAARVALVESRLAALESRWAFAPGAPQPPLATAPAAVLPPPNATATATAPEPRTTQSPPRADPLPPLGALDDLLHMDQGCMASRKTVQIAPTCLEAFTMGHFVSG